MSTIPPIPPPANGWAKWQELVLHELERHEAIIRDMQKDINALRQLDLPNMRDVLKDLFTAKLREVERAADEAITEVNDKVSRLEVKAGVWGLIGGMIPVAIAVVLWAIGR